ASRPRGADVPRGQSQSGQGYSASRSLSFSSLTGAPAPVRADLPGLAGKRTSIDPLLTEPWPSCASIPDGQAVDIAALEFFAGGFRHCFVEAGEAGPIKRLVTLLQALGERIGACQEARDLEARFAQMLLGFVFTFERADLNDPAAACPNLRGRRLGLRDIDLGR